MTHVVERQNNSDHRSDQKGKPPAGFQWIYFFGTEDGLEVKLGKSRQHPRLRKAQHENRNGHHEPLRWLAVLVGSPADESKLKSYFKAHCSRERSGEWLNAGEELRGYLRFLRDLPYVARDASADLEVLPQVDSEDWLPSGARRKSPAQLQIPDSEDFWADLDTGSVMEGDYYTHQTIIEAAREAMGGIDLDPASCAEANRVVKATRFFGAKEDGLLRNWAGKVWINPPFGAWGEEWAPKLIHEWRSGGPEQICALSSTRAITAQGFHPIRAGANAVWIAHGRYAFWGPKAGAPDEGHVVFYFGASTDRFKVAFERDGFGTVYERQAA